jgi:hypothetical protein
MEVNKNKLLGKTAPKTWGGFTRFTFNHKAVFNCPRLIIVCIITDNSAKPTYIIKTIIARFPQPFSTNTIAMGSATS